MTQDVGKLLPNEFGLFDMIGNICEFVQDYYAPLDNKYVVNPTGPASGTFRVCKGASWMEYAETPFEELFIRLKNIKCDQCTKRSEMSFEFFRSSMRARIKEDYFFSDLGFRLVREKIK